MSAPENDPGNLTIILEGFAPDSDHDPVSGLQKFFGIDADTARQFVESAPVVVKSKATRAVARQYVQTLHTIGARVRVESAADRALAAAPHDPSGSRPAPPASRPSNVEQPPTSESGGEPDDEAHTPPPSDKPAPPPNSRANIGRVNTREMAVLRRRPIETPGRPAPLLEREARDAANKQAANEQAAAARQASFLDTEVAEQERVLESSPASQSAGLWGSVPAQGWNPQQGGDAPPSADTPQVMLGGADLQQPPLDDSVSSLQRRAEHDADALRRENARVRARNATPPEPRPADPNKDFIVQRMDNYWANQSSIPAEPSDGLTVDGYMDDNEEFVIENNTAQIDISRFQQQVSGGLSVDEALSTSGLDVPNLNEATPSGVMEAPRSTEDDEEEALLQLVFDDEDDFQVPPPLQDEPDPFALPPSDDDIFALDDVPDSVAGQCPEPAPTAAQADDNLNAPGLDDDALFDGFEDPFSFEALPHAHQPGQPTPSSKPSPRAESDAAIPSLDSPFVDASPSSPASAPQQQFDASPYAVAGPTSSPGSGPSPSTRRAQRVFIPDSEPGGEGLVLPDIAVGDTRHRAQQRRVGRPKLYDERTTPDELRTHHPFWESLPKALKAPVSGTLSWYLAIPAVSLLAGCLTTGGVLAGPVFSLIIMALASSLVLGMTGNYFIASVDQSMQGIFESPPLPSLDGDALNQFAVRGLAVYGLLAVLFVAPMFVLVPAVQMVDAPASVDAGAQNADTGDNAVAGEDDSMWVQPWDPDDVFFDENGDEVRVPPNSSARVLRTKDGRNVLVDPRRRIVRLMGDEPPEKITEINPAAAFQETPIPQPTASTGPLVIFGLLTGLILLYVPMALTLGALNANIFQMYNPVMVFKGIFRGGVKYLFVAFSGVAISGVLFAVAATLMPMVGSLGTGAVCCMLPVLILMPSSIYIYTVGVQGHLMGLLIAENPDDFDEFSA